MAATLKKNAVHAAICVKTLFNLLVRLIVYISDFFLLLAGGLVVINAPAFLDAHAIRNLLFENPGFGVVLKRPRARRKNNSPRFLLSRFHSSAFRFRSLRLTGSWFHPPAFRS